MGFFSDLAPRRMLADTREYFFGEQKYKGRFLLAAAATTILVFLAFFYESGFEKEYEPPEIVWVQNADPDRSDADIERENLLRQIDKEIAQRKRERAEQERRDQFRRLADQLGMDTDE
ncbi:MAG: hypothetical protein R3E02_13985 [Blastomonas sp.]